MRKPLREFSSQDPGTYNLLVFGFGISPERLTTSREFFQFSQSFPQFEPTLRRGPLAVILIIFMYLLSIVFLVFPKDKTVFVPLVIFSAPTLILFGYRWENQKKKRLQKYEEMCRIDQIIATYYQDTPLEIDETG